MGIKTGGISDGKGWIGGAFHCGVLFLGMLMGAAITNYAWMS